MNLDTGILEPTADGTLLRIRGNKAHLLKLPGVRCENPKAREERRIYSKLFPKSKRIYLADQYDLAVREELGRGDPRHTNIFCFGANGYSDLGDERRKAWGVQEGAYEAACEGLIDAMIKSLMRDYPGIDLRIVHGASNVGIDKVLIGCAKRFSRGQLGHTCPGYLFYVDANDEVPVVCMETKEAYAEAFVRSLDLLLGCNGGDQAFMLDIGAIFKYKKHFMPVNVLRAIAKNGLPPATSADGKVNDAVAAFEHLVHVLPRATYANGDPYLRLVTDVCDTSRAIVRQGNINAALAFAGVAEQLHRVGL